MSIYVHSLLLPWTQNSIEQYFIPDINMKDPLYLNLMDLLDTTEKTKTKN